MGGQLLRALPTVVTLELLINPLCPAPEQPLYLLRPVSPGGSAEGAPVPLMDAPVPPPAAPLGPQVPPPGPRCPPFQALPFLEQLSAPPPPCFPGS